MAFPKYINNGYATSLKSIVTSPKSNTDLPYFDATYKMNVKYRNTILRLIKQWIIVWGLVRVFLVKKWCQSQLRYVLQCNFFAAAALEHKYCHRYSPSQSHRSITPLPTCLAGVFQRTRMSKIPSTSYRLRLLSPCCKRWVQRNLPKLQLFSMAIIFDVCKYIPMSKISNAEYMTRNHNNE